MRLVTPSDALRSPFFRLVADVQHAEEDFAPIAAVLRNTFDAYLARDLSIDLAKKSSRVP